MKLTKYTLRRLIKEQCQKALREIAPPAIQAPGRAPAGSKPGALGSYNPRDWKYSEERSGELSWCRGCSESDTKSVIRMQQQYDAFMKNLDPSVSSFVKRELRARGLSPDGPTAGDLLGRGYKGGAPQWVTDVQEVLNMTRMFLPTK